MRRLPGSTASTATSDDGRIEISSTDGHCRPLDAGHGGASLDRAHGPPLPHRRRLPVRDPTRRAAPDRRGRRRRRCRQGLRQHAPCRQIARVGAQRRHRVALASHARGVDRASSCCASASTPRSPAAGSSAWHARHSPFEASNWSTSTRCSTARRHPIARLDLALPDLFIGVECQSWRWHATPTARADDARRRRRLRALGWEIVEVWWTDLDRLDEVLDELVTLIDQRAGGATMSSSC